MDWESSFGNNQSIPPPPLPIIPSRPNNLLPSSLFLPLDCSFSAVRCRSWFIRASFPLPFSSLLSLLLAHSLTHSLLLILSFFLSTLIMYSPSFSLLPLSLTEYRVHTFRVSHFYFLLLPTSVSTLGRCPTFATRQRWTRIGSEKKRSCVGVLVS